MFINAGGGYVKEQPPWLHASREPLPAARTIGPISYALQPQQQDRTRTHRAQDRPGAVSLGAILMRPAHCQEELTIRCQIRAGEPRTPTPRRTRGFCPRKGAESAQLDSAACLLRFLGVGSTTWSSSVALEKSRSATSAIMGTSCADCTVPVVQRKDRANHAQVQGLITDNAYGRTLTSEHNEHRHTTRSPHYAAEHPRPFPLPATRRPQRRQRSQDRGA